jgi:biotin carboxylase
VTGRVVVVADPYSSGNLLAPALREAGLRPVAVTSTEQPAPVYAASYRPEDFDLVLCAEDRLAATVDRLRRLDPVRVMAGTESGVELADRLAAELTPELANEPALGPARRHKAAMSAAVAAAGLPTARQLCSDSAEEVAGWLDAQRLAGHDLVLKPPNSAGTDGVTFVPAGADWRAPFGALLGRENKLGLRNDQVLVQEYLTGTEFVVDTVSDRGRHTVVDICRYRKVHNAGHMAVYDSMQWLPYDQAGHRDLLEYTFGVLDAVGVRSGAAHTEVMLTPGGPRLLETAARLHGGGQPRFCRVATGDSQVDRLVRLASGAGELPGGYRLRQHVLVVFLLSPATGVVRNAEIYRRLPSLASYHTASVAVRSGDRVQLTSDLFSSLALGFVVLAHPDPDQVQADYLRIRELESELVIDPDPPGTGPLAPAAAVPAPAPGAGRAARR